MKTEPRSDIYTRVTATIIASLEPGTRPWTESWKAEPAAGSITRPLRANGQPYRGVNVLLLWGEAESNQGLQRADLDVDRVHMEQANILAEDCR